MSARFTLAGAFGAAILCGAIVAGCSGGSNSTPSAVTQSLGSGSSSNGSGGGSSSNSSSKTAQVTIKVIVPSKTTSSAKRAPKYVSPNTTTVNVLANGAQVGSIPCAAGICSGSAQVPVSTTSLTIQLTDGSGNILSQATQAVVINAGATNSFTFTFDGIAATLAVSSSTLQLVATGVATTVPITVTPIDLSGSPIVAPGDVIDAAGNVIISADGSTQTVTLTSSSSHLSLAAPLQWITGSYALSGMLNYDGGDPNPNGVPDTITLTPSTTADASTFLGALALNVVPPAMFVGPYPLTTPNGYTVSVPVAVATDGQTNGNTSIEVPQANGQSTNLDLYLYTNFTPSVGSDITLNYDGCSGNEGVPSVGQDFPSPGPVPYTATRFQVSVSATSATQCTFQLSLSGQSQPMNANATIYFNQPSLIIQGVKRK
jgi:hypothetical protein